MGGGVLGKVDKQRRVVAFVRKRSVSNKWRESCIDIKSNYFKETISWSKDDFSLTIERMFDKGETLAVIYHSAMIHDTADYVHEMTKITAIQTIHLIKRFQPDYLAFYF